MLRTISISGTSLRSLFQNRAPHCSIPNQTPSSSSISSSLISNSLYSTSSRQEEDRNEVVSLVKRDPTAPPKLFVVQPRLRPDTILQAKLNEALSLANSLEEQRNGSFENDVSDKEIPPHIVVQNPIVRHQTRAGRLSLFFLMHNLPFFIQLCVSSFQLMNCDDSNYLVSGNIHNYILGRYIFWKRNFGSC